MGTIFFMSCEAATSSSNGHRAPTPDEAGAFGKRAAAIHGKHVNGVICTRDDHAFSTWRAFLKAHGTTYTSVHISEAPDVVSRGLEEAFDRAKKDSGNDDPAVRRAQHIRLEIIRLVDYAAGGSNFAVLVVAPADLIQPILHLIHTRWRGDQVAPPPLGPYGLVVVNVDAAKDGQGHSKNNGDYVVANFQVVSAEHGAGAERAPAASAVTAAPAV